MRLADAKRLDLRRFLRRSSISARVSETGSQSDCFLEFCPSEIVSKISLQEIRLGLVSRCPGLTAFGNEYDTLSKLILRQALAFLPKIQCLLGYGDHVLGPLNLVITTFDRDGHLFL